MPPNQRKAGVTRLDRNLDIRLKRVLYIEVDHVSPRSHEVSNDPPAKIQSIYQQFVAWFRSLLRRLGLRKNNTELLFTVDKLRVSDWLHSEKCLQNPRRRGL